jgi:hypothetical protein
MAGLIQLSREWGLVLYSSLPAIAGPRLACVGHTSIERSILRFAIDLAATSFTRGKPRGFRLHRPDDSPLAVGQGIVVSELSGHGPAGKTGWIGRKW